MKKTASEHYRQRRGNCAQSVVFAWNTANPGRPANAELFSAYGGGRAPDGLCGALYASCAIAETSVAETIKKSFSEKSGGHVKCREIRKAKTLTCAGCVELAAELLEKHSRNATTDTAPS